MNGMESFPFSRALPQDAVCANAVASTARDDRKRGGHGCGFRVTDATWDKTRPR